MNYSAPLYYFVLVALLTIVVFFILFRRKTKMVSSKSNVLDLEDGRRLAILCMTPRTTNYLKTQYDEWQRESHVVVLGGYNFDDYMRLLEKQSHINYNDESGKWSVSPESLTYIEKYHGEVYRK